VNTAMASATHKSVRQDWLEHGTALGVLVVLALLAFHDAVTAAVQVWWVSPTYSHCFLIVPISAWLIWERRALLAKQRPVVEPRVLWLVPPLLVVWWLGELSTINEVRQLAAVAILQTAIVAMLGLSVARTIWFAIFYLFFLVPTGEYLIIPMQHFATVFTDWTLNLIGVPHFTEGTVIELTNGRFEIAEACAGLRFLIATVALGVLFSYMMFRKWFKIVLFLLASFIVPLIGNGLRVVGIILLAHYTNNEYGAGADHLVYGWGFNVAILLVLFFLGSLFRDSIDDNINEAPPAERTDTTGKTLRVLALAGFAIGIGPAVGYWHDSRVVEPDIGSLSQPLHLQGWHASPSVDQWRPLFPGIDAQIEESLLSDDAATTADLYVGYYARPRTRHSLTAHVNKLWDVKDWTPTSSGTATARLGSHTIQLQEWIVTSASQKRLIWATYWVDGSFTTSLFKVKLMQARAAFGGHEGQAVVAVSTVIDGTDDQARASLTRVLAALNDLPNRLDGANRRDPIARNSK